MMTMTRSRGRRPNPFQGVLAFDEKLFAEKAAVFATRRREALGQGTPSPAPLLSSPTSLSPIAAPPARSRGRRRARAATAEDARPKKQRLTHADIAGAPEAVLIEQAKRGDHRAARKLLEAHAPLIHRWAMKTARWSGVEEEDLVQEAELGFMEGVRRFDPTRGVKLMSMATWWIRHAVEHYAQETMRLIRLPAAQQSALVARSKRGEERTIGRKHREAAAAVFASPVHSLDAPMNDGDLTPFVETMPSEVASPEDEVVDGEERTARQHLLVDALATLTDRERMIVRLRLVDDDPQTLEEIGEQLGVSRERVRQIELEALKKLRCFFAEYGTESDRELCAAFMGGHDDFEHLCVTRPKRPISPRTSSYAGVGWDGKLGRWRVTVYARGRQYFVGNFADEIEAAKARDVAATRLIGAGAKLNFPPSSA